MPDSKPSFFNRVAQSDSTRKGIASAVVGVLVAAVIELWPKP